MAVDSGGNVFVADYYSVRKIDPTGMVTSLMSAVGTQPFFQSAITVSPSGMLYLVANNSGSNAGAVYSINSTGTTALIAAQIGKGGATGIVMGGDGNLYVTDRNSSSIYRVTLAGVVTTVVSSADLPIGTVLGGLPRKINSPSGLALLSTGNSVSLAVVDSFEHAILRVDLP